MIFLRRHCWQACLTCCRLLLLARSPLDTISSVPTSPSTSGIDPLSVSSMVSIQVTQYGGNAATANCPCNMSSAFTARQVKQTPTREGTKDRRSTLLGDHFRATYCVSCFVNTATRHDKAQGIATMATMARMASLALKPSGRGAGAVSTICWLTSAALKGNTLTAQPKSWSQWHSLPSSHKKPEGLTNPGLAYVHT